VRHNETVISSVQAFGVPPSSVSQKRVSLTAPKLKAFQARSWADCTWCALFPDTIHRKGEAFLVALSVDLIGGEDGLGVLAGRIGEL